MRGNGDAHFCAETRSWRTHLSLKAHHNTSIPSSIPRRYSHHRKLHQPLHRRQTHLTLRQSQPSIFIFHTLPFPSIQRHFPMELFPQNPFLSFSFPSTSLFLLSHAFFQCFAKPFHFSYDCFFLCPFVVSSFWDDPTWIGL